MNTTLAQSTAFRRLNVGCGHDVRPGWVNLDVAPLSGVDVVHDLNVRPWPFADDSFDEIEMINVLEHLDNTVSIMEELHRIVAPGGRVIIRVPYWNSPDAISDPTHRTQFNENTFTFFDPSTRSGRERSYYSTAQFRIERQFYYKRIIAGLPYLRITWPVIKPVLVFFARRLGSVIWVLEVELRALKSPTKPRWTG